MTKIQQIWKLYSRLIAFGVAVVIALAVNVLIGTVNIRKDLTEEKLYELSDGTREILGALEQPVTLKFFFNSSSPEVPMPLKTYANRVEDLLREYELAGDGNVTLEKYDPKPDSDAEDWARKYGVAGQAMGMIGPSLYIGLVAVMGDAEAVLPVLDPRTEDLLEYNVTRMITRVATPKKPVVGVISSLPVMGAQRPPYPMPNQPPPAPAWFAFSDLQQDYDVRELSMPVDEIDSDVDALILVHPKDLPDETLFAIDQFVLKGGSLLAFLDPNSIVEAETQPSQNMQMQFQAKSSNLERLLDAWDVTFDSGKVVADLEAISRLRTQNNQVEDSPVWLSLRKNHMNADDILTAHLESVMMPFAGVFEATGSDGLEVTSLVSSSESSSLVDAMQAQFGGDSIRRDFKSGFTRLNLAIRLHGTFKTAFPEGDPSAESDDAEESGEGETEEKAEKTKAASLMESVEPGTVVLIGDTDMIYDRFCVREVNFFGYGAQQPINDNLSFFANIVDQLAGSAALVGIRTRGRSERPFEVVLDLQRIAQEQYMEEENRLQKRLDEAQRKLGELQAKKDEKQRFILSSEQQKAIESFQEEVVETKQQLKLVRRKLREDIEKLGVKMKVLNILLMPCLIAVAGVGFGVYRKRKVRG